MTLALKRIDDLIEDIIDVEGGYSNDPSDSGGETKYGITVAVARANGYAGAMKDLPRALARSIYFQRYVIDPGFDKVMELSPRIAAELVDTGVNSGTATAGKFLQRALNMFNLEGSLWPDLTVDGGVGERTIAALRAFLNHREGEGEGVMLFSLNALQFCHFENLAVKRPKDEKYAYGWAFNRGWLQLLEAATANP